MKTVIVFFILLLLRHDDVIFVRSFATGTAESVRVVSSSINTSSRSVLFAERKQNENQVDATAVSTSDGRSSTIVPPRFPTSVIDQVRQAADAIYRAELDGKIYRHSIRLLLPLIGATELDDWPGGVPQQRDAASPLVSDILNQLEQKHDGDVSSLQLQESYLNGGNNDDGVRIVLSQSSVQAKNDACAILLPTAQVVQQIQSFDKQVGPNRHMILVNSQFKRTSDFGNAFGGFFGNKNNDEVKYIEETFHPTFICTSFMVEGEQIRILRSYPGPWRVYKLNDPKNIDPWIQIGTKEVMLKKKDGNTSNSGLLFNYGQPTYQEIENMIKSQEGYVPKSLSERASNAFTFIKDTL